MRMKYAPVLSSPVNSIVATTVSTKKRSAIGSSIAPHRDVACTRRASQPSRKSVIAATPMIPTRVSVAARSDEPRRQREPRAGEDVGQRPERVDVRSSA